MIERAHRRLGVAYDSEDAADFRFLYVPGKAIATGDDETIARIDEAIDRRGGDLDANGAGVRRVSDRSETGICNYEVDTRDGGHQTFERALTILDDELGPGVVTPDHYVHVSATIGGSKPCPATEPEETGLIHPWPGLTGDDKAGSGVRVAVVDTGWHELAATRKTTAKFLGRGVGPLEPIDIEPYPASGQLAQYAGHGTFIAGVVKCRARAARVDVLRYGNGGAIPESELVEVLGRALNQPEPPHIIVLSAGCRTRRDLDAVSFRGFWQTTLSQRPDTVLVAAAGNDETDEPFYPAASPWAVGVGSLDRDGEVSNFSNYGSNADVFLLGRNHVNAFPRGHYVCKEPPNKGDFREFDNGLARWSGTSFAAPLFAGLLARRLPNRASTKSVRDVAWQMVNGAPLRPSHPIYGNHHVIHRRTFP